jgi:hypothetical protein
MPADWPWPRSGRQKTRFRGWWTRTQMIAAVKSDILLARASDGRGICIFICGWRREEFPHVRRTGLFRPKNKSTDNAQSMDIVLHESLANRVREATAGVAFSRACARCHFIETARYQNAPAAMADSARGAARIAIRLRVGPSKNSMASQPMGSHRRTDKTPIGNLWQFLSPCTIEAPGRRGFGIGMSDRG